MTRQSPGDLDRETIRDEMEHARQAFHQLLDHATPGELQRPSDGTRWTNEQLLFHMLFGYYAETLSPDQLRRILHRRGHAGPPARARRSTRLTPHAELTRSVAA